MWRMMTKKLKIRFVSDELKPCPFCGGEAEFLEDEFFCHYSVACTECGAGTDAYGVERDAIEAWNGRIKPTFTPDELDAIRRNVCDRQAERELSKIEQSIIDKCDARLKGVQDD